MPLAADLTQLQTKVLNTSKGPAVQHWELKLIKYPLWMKGYIENSDINIIEGKVISLEMNSNKIIGVILSDKKIIKADAVIIATGTFLRSKTMKGKEIIVGEPDGKASTKGISEQLRIFWYWTDETKNRNSSKNKKIFNWFSVLKEELGSEKGIFFIEDIKIKKILKHSCLISIYK